MRVLVTGGSGHLGSRVVRHLIEHGYSVVNADRRPLESEIEPDRADVYSYRELDLTDVGQVAGAMAGVDAVVHLGAIPAPGRHPDETIFRQNTTSTFAVLHSASLLGIRRAVIASSLSALGMAYATHPFTPLYAPVDEEHPLLPQDPYGLSKQVDESIAATFCRRTGMTILAYRFQWIASVQQASETAEALRDEPEQLAHNLWGWVDLRDAAAACRLGLEAEVEGFEAFNITAGDTVAYQPTADLIRRYCPKTELRAELEGVASGFSTEKARRMLGYTPRHTWRQPARE
ncbi:MAG: NAD(P)-dependent oxidoreductase [Chloroflexota bacterium]|nr:NAD(P)-dependent oxidoreductase [Chloroflexota bacterium]